MGKRLTHEGPQPAFGSSVGSPEDHEGLCRELGAFWCHPRAAAPVSLSCARFFKDVSRGRCVFRTEMEHVSRGRCTFMFLRFTLTFLFNFRGGTASVLRGPRHFLFFVLHARVFVMRPHTFALHARVFAKFTGEELRHSRSSASFLTISLVTLTFSLKFRSKMWFSVSRSRFRYIFK